MIRNERLHSPIITLWSDGLQGSTKNQMATTVLTPKAIHGLTVRKKIPDNSKNTRTDRKAIHERSRDADEEEVRKIDRLPQNRRRIR